MKTDSGTEIANSFLSYIHQSVCVECIGWTCDWRREGDICGIAGRISWRSPLARDPLYVSALLHYADWVLGGVFQ